MINNYKIKTGEKPFPKKFIIIIISSILLIFTVGYIILINNPIVIYYCDRNAADTIISKEAIIQRGRNLHSKYIRPIIISVSEYTVNGESSLDHGQVRLTFLPVTGIFGAYIMDCSIHDAPDFRPYFYH